MANQRTVARPVEVRGRGLHTGEESVLTLRAAPEHSGIRFRRIDLPGSPHIPATPAAVGGVRWETSLRGGDGGEVRTAEHLLAAAHALRVDNLLIEIAGPEVPALDGSAEPWCRALREAGLAEQATRARRLRIDRPIHLAVGSSRYSVLPSQSYRVSGSISFDHPLIAEQFVSAAMEPELFQRDIAPARTFGLAAWRDELRAEGFALGASLENTIVLSERGLEGGQELRYPDEFVRHKVLDLIGDLALVGARLQCHVIAEQPGHRGNVRLARRLAAELDTEPGAIMDVNDIMKILPHRYPMLLLDRVTELEAGRRITGLKNVSANEPFFAGHYPGHPIMPGVLILEALGQCGSLLLMSELENPAEKVIHLLSVDKAKFRRPVVPGDQLEFELEIIQRKANRGRLKGVARVDGKMVAEVTMLGHIVDR